MLKIISVSLFLIFTTTIKIDGLYDIKGKWLQCGTYAYRFYPEKQLNKKCPVCKERGIIMWRLDIRHGNQYNLKKFHCNNCGYEWFNGNLP